MTLARRDPVQLGLPGEFTRTGWTAPPGLSFEAWAEVGDKLSQIEQAVMWWIGDWWAYGEHSYGERAAQAVDSERWAFQTFADAGWVSRKIETSRRREVLPWSHHKEVAALEPEEQDKFLEAAIEEDWTHKELRAAVRHYKRNLVSDPPLPGGVFDVIYADPPWPYTTQIESWGPTSLHYPTMELDEIKALKVPAAENATLFLWATNPFLKSALEVVDAWGFEYKTNIVWVKTNLKRPGSGYYIRGRHELLFICARGSNVPDQYGKEPIGSVLYADALEHSQKPPEVYDLIERIYPGRRYLELFARQERPGWTAWGNERGISRG